MTFEKCKVVVQSKIELCNDYVQHILSKDNNNMCLLMKQNAESVYKVSFKKLIWEDILVSENVTEMEQKIQNYIQLSNDVIKNGRLMDCTNSIIYNICTLWDRETLLSIKSELQAMYNICQP